MILQQALGLGIGIIANMAYDERTDRDLVRLPVDHLFEPSVTHIGFRRGLFLRGYMYDFLQAFAPHLKRELVDEISAVTEPEERRKLTLQRIPNIP